MIKIAKYKDTRHWAVVCYKKGAHAIKQLLDRLKAQKSLSNTDIKPS